MLSSRKATEGSPASAPASLLPSLATAAVGFSAVLGLLYFTTGIAAGAGRLGPVRDFKCFLCCSSVF